MVGEALRVAKETGAEEAVVHAGALRTLWQAYKQRGKPEPFALGADTLASERLNTEVTQVRVSCGELRASRAAVPS